MFKKEVYVTQSMEKANQLKDILKQYNIESTIKVSNSENANFSIFTPLFSYSRRARGNFMEKSGYSNFYYVLVHKKDFEEATQLLQKIK